MNLSKEQEEKLVLILQGFLGVLIFALSIRNSASVRTKEMKKAMAKNARQEGRLAKREYRWKRKLMNQKYRRKLAENKRRPSVHLRRIMVK